MQVVPLEPRRRLSGDDGSALVEAGLMSPVMFFIFLAIVEFGFFFSSYDAVGRAASDGVRAASVLGNDSAADWEILQSIKASVAGIDASRVEKIVIFKAKGPETVAPVACTAGAGRARATVGTLTKPLVGSCNGYTGPADLTGGTVKAQYGCVTPNNLSEGYCPTSRKVAFTGVDGPPDFIGVYIRYTHHYVTGLFGSTHVLTETMITRAEPQTVS